MECSHGGVLFYIYVFSDPPIVIADSESNLQKLPPQLNNHEL